MENIVSSESTNLEMGARFDDAPLELRGDVVIELYDRENNLIERRERKNLILNAARDSMARLIAAANPSYLVTTFGVGTGTAAPTPTDSALTSPFTKALDGVTFPSMGKAVFAWSLDYSEANGKAITEYALINAGGQLFSRLVQPVINKTSAFRLAATWSIQF